MSVRRRVRWDYGTSVGTLARTSTATIANVKTSPSLLAGPPSNISGAAQVAVFAMLESWGLTTEFSPRTIDVSPKSVRRARPSPSIRMFPFELVGINKYLIPRKPGNERSNYLRPSSHHVSHYTNEGSKDPPPHPTAAEFDVRMFECGDDGGGTSTHQVDAIRPRVLSHMFGNPATSHPFTNDLERRHVCGNSEERDDVGML